MEWGQVLENHKEQLPIYSPRVAEHTHTSPSLPTGDIPAAQVHERQFYRTSSCDNPCFIYLHWQTLT